MALKRVRHETGTAVLRPHECNFFCQGDVHYSLWWSRMDRTPAELTELYLKVVSGPREVLSVEVASPEAPRYSPTGIGPYVYEARYRKL